MMISRATKISSVARRSYVSLPCNINLSHPRLAIAKNMYKLKKITAADSEQAVRAALKDAITAEEVANQPNLSAFERNLLMTTAKTYHAPFVPNPHVWQNMPYGTYVYKEYLMNSNNFAFIFGFAIMGYICAYSLPLAWVAAQPEKMRTSKYLSMLEGRGGHLRTVEEHARFLAGEEEHPPSHGGHGGH